MSERIRIVVSRHAVFYTPLIATVAAGFMENEGLEGVYSVKPPDRGTFDMLAAGEVDVVQAAVSSNWGRIERGARNLPVHFAQINQRDGFWITSREDKSFNWKDLEGRELIADQGPQPMAMLRYAARRQGVDWMKVRLIEAGTPDQMDRTFREGSGDFVHQQGPWPQQLERDGVGRVAASVGAAMPMVAFSSIMASPDYLETAGAAAFMRAYRNSLRWVRSTAPAQIAGRLGTYFEAVSADALEDAVLGYQRIGCWPEDPRIPETLYEQALDVFLESGGIPRRYRYSDVVVEPPTAA